MTVLVTGGAGLIGSNLVRFLVRQGIHVIVADNLWRGRLENLFEGTKPVIDLERQFFDYDLRDFDQCLDLAKRATHVVHLADIVGGINYVFAHQLSLFRANLLINSNMLAAAIDGGISTFIYAGTACSYPVEKQNAIGLPPLKETDAYPANPESSYGWSKLMGEYECELAQSQGAINSTVLRFHNVYGPASDLTPERSQVIPALCRKAINYPSEQFVVWGSGKQRRTFLFVEDAVKALFCALERGGGDGVIQIGTHYSQSISEIAEIIVRLSQKDIAIHYDPSKPEGDVDRTPDLSRAKKVLNWSPSVSISEGLEITYRWAKKEIDSC